MKKLLLPFIISGLLLACNNNQSTSQTENKSEIETKPQVLKEVIPIQDEDKAQITTKTDCNAISQALNNITNSSTIDEIETIEHQLTECLPTTDNATQLQWANEYINAYQKFLSLWHNDKPILNQNSEILFDNIVYDYLYHQKQPSDSDLNQLPKRVAYLLDLGIRKKIQLVDMCEGIFGFSADYGNFTQIITPHLPKDQAVFIQRLTKDNQDIFWCDAGIAISLRELIERTLFWQDFIQKYPESQFIDDAKYLYQFYEYHLFFGSENTHWLEDDKTAFIDYTEEGDNKTIEEHFIDLAKQDNALGKKAHAYLEFVATPVDKREQKYPLKSEEYPSEEYEEWQKIELARLQLHTALGILNNPTDGSTDCFSAPICLEQPYD